MRIHNGVKQVRRMAQDKGEDVTESSNVEFADEGVGNLSLVIRLPVARCRNLSIFNELNIRKERRKRGGREREKDLILDVIRN